MPLANAPISVSIQPTFRMFFQALLWLSVKRSPLLCVGFPIIMMLTLLSHAILVLAPHSDGTPRVNAATTLQALAILFTVWAFVTLVVPLLGARQAVRSPSCRGVFEYVFSDSGIDITAPHSNAHMDWDLICRVAETSQLLMLFVNKQQAHVIPKSALAPGDLSALRALLRASVHGKLKLKG